MNVTKTITIDLNRPKKNVVHLDQNDTTRIIHLVLLCDGVPFDPEGGVSNIVKSVKYLASDGSGDENTGGVTIVTGTTNEYNVALNHGETAVPGFTEVFVVFSKNGNVLHTFPITLDVIKTEPNISPSESSYGMFLRKDAQTAKTSSMTAKAGIDENGTIWFEPGGGSGGIQKLTATITQSGSSYSCDMTYSDIADAISNGDIVEANTPNGLAHFDGLDGTNFIFTAHTDIGDAMRVVRYSINSSNMVGRAQYDVDNALIPQTTVTTIAESTYTILPVANYQYIFSNPVLSLEISANYATTGDWSIEFDAPTNVAPSVTIPSALKTTPASQTFSANHHYEINCHNGYAVIAEW